MLLKSDLVMFSYVCKGISKSKTDCCSLRTVTKTSESLSSLFIKKNKQKNAVYIKFDCFSHCKKSLSIFKGKLHL